MKNAVLMMVLIFTSMLVGCSQQPTHAEVYQPLGNEKKLFGIQFFQDKESVVKQLGKPESKEKGRYRYTNKGLNLFFEDKEMQNATITNPDYKIGESISVGERIDKIIEEEIRLTFYQIDSQSDKEASTIYFSKSKYKVSMNIKNGQVEEMTVFPEETPFSKYVINKKSKITDRELKLNSEYLNFKPNVERNNKRVLLGEFEKYVSLGIVDGVPVPLGMKEKELVRRYEDGEFIFKDILGGSSEQYLFYRQFGVYFGIYNESVKEIVIPVTIKEEKLLASYPFKNKKLLIGKDKEVSYETNNGIVSTIIITENNSGK